MSEPGSTRIILLRPRNPRNIGAAARAMANFGLDDLVVVSPHPPVWEEVRVSALGADKVVSNARVVDDLLDAVSDCTLVIGTADRRRGGNFDPAQAVKLIAGSSGKTAIIFGSEKSGLANTDLSFCHEVLTIPTTDESPSLNLGQAVAIVCYELSRPPTSIMQATTEATVNEVETFLRRSVELMKVSGYFAGGNEERLTEEFRRSILRRRPTSREISLWLGAVNKISRENANMRRKA